MLCVCCVREYVCIVCVCCVCEFWKKGKENNSKWLMAGTSTWHKLKQIMKQRDNEGI